MDPDRGAKNLKFGKPGGKRVRERPLLEKDGSEKMRWTETNGRKPPRRSRSRAVASVSK